MATEMVIREAAMTDLDAMVDVYLAAFSMEPVWSYVFCYHHLYPEETRKLTTLEFTRHLENKDRKLKFLVAEMPKMEDNSVIVVVAICLWAFPYPLDDVDDDVVEVRVQQDPEPGNEHDPFENRRDVDPEREKAYNAAVTKAEEKYHDVLYGEQQIRLKLLATHPDYQGHGVASNLVTFGMCLGRTHFKVLTVLAGPMGKTLYTKLGFYEHGVEEVHVEEEEDRVYVTAMVCNAI